MERAALYFNAAAETMTAFTVGNGDARVHIARAFDTQQTRVIADIFVTAADFQRVTAICRA